MPVLVVNNNRLLALDLLFVIFDNHISLFRATAVKLFAVFVILVDALADFVGFRTAFGHKQLHRLRARLHTSRRIDARTNLEDDVGNGDFLVRQAAELYDASETHIRIRVQSLQTIVSKHTVFAHDWHNISSNTYSAQIQQTLKPIHIVHAITDSKTLHKLEAYTAAAQFLERIFVVFEFGVKDSHSIGQNIVGHMVVTHNEIDTQRLGIGNFFNRLNTAVENNNQLYANTVSIIHAFYGYAITLIVARGHIVLHV